MALKEYKQKRRFTVTPEPQGGKPSGKTLQFVVQKHAASRLHYDFRLEMKGVLKSWAIPKGPSLNPADKRLAMQVEDHPWDYKDFEGVIPAGNYGAGTVMVWDEGTYESLEETNGQKRATGALAEGPSSVGLPGRPKFPKGRPGNTKAAQEKALLKGLREGSLKFRLNGQKLKGEFALVRTKGKEENSWLLIKHRDRYASEKPVTDKDKSVLSKKTLEQIAKDPKAKEWVSNRSVKTKAPKIGQEAAMPANIPPMQATLVDKPFDEEGWSYEIKWDGVRTLAYLKKGKVELRSRNNKSFDKYYPVFDALKGWTIDAVLDGEIVVLNEKGQSEFNRLQNWRSEADGELIYYVFDLLWLEGKDLMGLPLVQRRKLLKGLIPAEGLVRFSESFETSGTKFFGTAEKLGLEGIIAKKTDSLYTPGVRTKEWLKIKTMSRQEVVIGGYTRKKGTPKPFSSLLAGVFENGRLKYTGKIGTGFTEKMQKEMLKRFKPLERKEPPFGILPDVNKPAPFRPASGDTKIIWLKPELVCEVTFREMTGDGLMRQPSFKGMREDKDARDVVRETAVKAKTVRNAIRRPVKQGERKPLLNSSDESQMVTINGQELSFTHLDKVFWPKEKYTKRNLLNYYHQVASYLLPYMVDRPQSLNRQPNGINGPSFFQKNVKGKVPGWIKTFPYHSAEDPEDKEFLVCTDEASLLYIISLGCIEVNPWSSRVKTPDNPDWCIIDLDPDRKTPFDKVIEAAQVTKKILDAAGIESYCKTSGSTGLHVYFPLGAKYTYEESKEFARVVVERVNAEIPAYTTLERTLSARKGRMYLDFLQNRPQATIAAPYAVRPKPGATVSAPLHWEEVKKGLSMQAFTIQTMGDRLKEVGDLFQPVLGKGADLKKALQKLESSAR
ncbi:DNA ligase D [Puia dinghuensis]|uniref:DNA ligase (ATP) n=1 Tax=Puia dinghuensis TaxID=1792502 RepID=A0A8J2UD19_9BACT|nr:DNA ligase D [Puia dinghuensis]GGA99183.1 ATP-dependent DNA ligase [Puia dinghuensis]